MMKKQILAKRKRTAEAAETPKTTTPKKQKVVASPKATQKVAKQEEEEVKKIEEIEEEEVEDQNNGGSDDEDGGNDDDLNEIAEIANTQTKKNVVIDSGTTFEQLGLHPQLCETCTKLGYKHPTNIQKDSLPYAIQGKDIIGIAETGSGKTASFVLPILHQLLSAKSKPSPCSALVLTPTRELAVQIKEHFDALGSDIGLKTLLLVGGEEMRAQQLAIRQLAPHVVVGTPGRITEHLRETKGFNLHYTKFFVLDEADKMLGPEFESYLNIILENSDKQKRQVQLYSATMTKKVEKLQKVHLKDPVKIQIAGSKYATVATLKQEYLFIPEKYKEVYLAYLLNENAGKRIIIFVSQNVTCITLSILLRSLGFPAVPLSGHMGDTDRLHCLRKFKSGERPILIGTDVAARGLDIPLVELVINYDIPVHSKEYVHRVGRTARIGKEGRAITLVTQYDIEYFQKIEKLIGKKMAECPTVKDDVMALVNTVSKAMKLAKQKVKLNDAAPVSKEEGEDQANDEEEVLSSAIKQLAKKRQLSRDQNTKRNAKRRKKQHSAE